MKTVFFDVDTQLDFLYPAGALYVPGAEDIVPRLAKLTEFAASRNIEIISTADAHLEDDADFKIWKPHCVAGTLGQRKEPLTMLPAMQQVIIEKRVLDPFSNPNLRPLLRKLAADRYVLYGVVTEICVKCAADGLLQTGARVELVTDAIKSLSAADEETFLREFTARDGVLTTASAVLNG
jgi:nicotinamidase/pyrazinamidase